MHPASQRRARRWLDRFIFGDLASHYFGSCVIGLGSVFLPHHLRLQQLRQARRWQGLRELLWFVSVLFGEKAYWWGKRLHDMEEVNFGWKMAHREGLTRRKGVLGSLLKGFVFAAMFWRMAKGGLKASPFGSDVVEYRKAVDEWLSSKGYRSPLRRSWICSSKML